VIGSSTGGPEALTRLLAALPASFPTPIVVVQHMPASFTPLLAERLDALSALRVTEARAGEYLEPGHVYVAPGERHTVVTRAGDALVAATDDGAPLNSCRPSIDKLLKSAVMHCGGDLLVAILTGMGQDGAVGAREVAAQGGIVLAQDEATSTVWGMPRAVIEMGVADCTLPLDAIGPEIVRRAGGRHGAQQR
jgi:two-component system chemotaxis response regulator CheB